MLQPSEIRHRFHFLEQAIGQAAQAMSGERNLPSELRDSIERVDRLSDTARDILLSQDEPRIRKLIGDMDALAQRAKRICVNMPQLSAQMRAAVNQVLNQVTELKRDVR